MQEESIQEADVRVGVFVCHCGTNIGGFIDVPRVVEYTKTLPSVAHVERNLYTCAEDGLTAIKAAIEKYDLNRVVVASCTPRTHAPLFMSACEEVGLNPYLFEFVNIRDQCSWVHMHEKEKATEKAMHLVKIGVAKAVLLEPLERIEVSVEKSAMVIGGGISGMTAANSLADQGFDVYLIERDEKLGGMVSRLNKVFPTDRDPSDILDPLIESLQNHEKVRLLTSSTVKEVKGYIGNFDVTVTEEKRGKNRSFKVGTIIVATGAIEFEPEGLYGYGKYKNVVTQLQLERLLRDGELRLPKKVVMIQCVGSRGQGEISYCSRICCMTAIKNSTTIKESSSESEVTVLYRDIQMYGVQYEDLYRRARELGVKFIKYTRERPPSVTEDEGNLKVEVYDKLFGRQTELLCDLVVLSTPLTQPEEVEDLSKTLRVPLGQDRFFFEAHVKLRPIDFSTDGIYLCGTAQGPKDIPESVGQALGAASRALAPLRKGRVDSEPITAVINKDLCIGCGSCVPVCPYNAIAMKFEDGRLISESNPLLCKGCGVCAATCPAHAIKMQHFTDDQILAQVSAALDVPIPGDEPIIIGFCCNWCSYAGADMAGVSRFQYPPNIRIIRVMCSGRVDPTHILWAFLNGADGVFISGCHPADCHYVHGNEYARRQVEKLKEMLERTEVDPKRLRLEWVSASEGKRFSDLVTEFTRQIKELGPSPIRMRGVVIG